MTFRDYVQLMKLRIGAMIALTAVMGYAAVADEIRLPQIGLLVVAMLLGSASSAVFNHFYDRDIDRLMARTASRPLASGAMSHPSAVLSFAAVLLVLGLGIAVVSFNMVVALHLFLGAFIYGVVYTVWLKRRTSLNIVIGGAAGSFAVLAGAAAVDPGIWLLPMLLAVTLFLWTPSHFWALAILLREDYRQAGVPMLPVLVGDEKTAKAIFVNSVLLVGSSLLPWALGELGAIYGVGAALLGAGLLWANWKLLQDPSRLWARRNFLASMPYLMGLFIAILADVHL
ncbi:MAG: protoheme IX farnesyltransferase [Rhodospirillales bacterium]|nr:protoheme IX farnesyltransferase [Rhodospirillales bacterium]